MEQITLLRDSIRRQFLVRKDCDYTFREVRDLLKIGRLSEKIIKDLCKTLKKDGISVERIKGLLRFSHNVPKSPIVPKTLIEEGPGILPRQLGIVSGVRKGRAQKPCHFAINMNDDHTVELRSVDAGGVPTMVARLNREQVNNLSEIAGVASAMMK